jgi:hypothetical protein
MLISLPRNSSFLSLTAAPSSPISLASRTDRDPRTRHLPLVLPAVSDLSTGGLFSVSLAVSGLPVSGSFSISFVVCGSRFVSGVCVGDGILLFIVICDRGVACWSITIVGR